MRGVVLAISLLFGCGGGQPKSGGGSTSSSCAKPIKGSYLVRYAVVPNYEMKDRGAVIDLVRTEFKRIVEEDLAGSELTLTEAQGQPHQIMINISVLNDGNDNYNLSVIASAETPSFMMTHYQEYTYTDPARMIADYAHAIARKLREGQCN